MARSALLDFISKSVGLANILVYVRVFWFPAHGPNEDPEQLPHWGELKLGLVFMLWFWLVREYIVGKLMVEKLGAYLGIMIDSIALKLVNQWLNLGMHIFSTVFSVVYLSRQKWTYDLLRGDSGALYRGITLGSGLPMDVYLKAFYNLHLGYQLHALQYTVIEGRKFQGDRRADFREMLIHHVIAVSLIAIGAASRPAPRVGVVTMLLHNASDIVVCATKSAKLLGWRKASVWLLPVMTVTWLVTRLILFPLFVLRHTVVFHPFNRPPAVAVSFLFCVSGVLVLFCLNIFWFSKFLQMCNNVIRHGSAVDVTESLVTNQVADKYGLWNKQRWWQVGVATAE
eukprot:TRINITY_DN21692_c0_g1_i1.p2 TRINITY_DN21692_c0_g1~~TRINITY_DN21692_c0_g1_i1.p2  ORF type:complete len:341 (+),score=91.49 TRINITY_DN21692_c0_g1_i1:135-1157(+)